MVDWCECCVVSRASSNSQQLLTISANIALSSRTLLRGDASVPNVAQNARQLGLTTPTQPGRKQGKAGLLVTLAVLLMPGSELVFFLVPLHRRKHVMCTVSLIHFSIMLFSA
jgi:hypothetical protein